MKPEWEQQENTIMVEDYPVPEEAREEAEPFPPPESTVEEEVYLIVQPVGDPCRVLRFCQSVRRIEGVQIALFTSSHKEASIKLSLRQQVPLLDLLGGMAEVAATSLEEYARDGCRWDLPPFITPYPAKAIRVVLSPA